VGSGPEEGARGRLGDGRRLPLVEHRAVEDELARRALHATMCATEHRVRGAMQKLSMAWPPFIAQSERTRHATCDGMRARVLAAKGGEDARDSAARGVRRCPAHCTPPRTAPAP
jgi:hypothetical protein